VSGPERVGEILERRIAEAILHADHCPSYLLADPVQCDGLDGCDECLRLAARAVLEELGKEAAA
jgi:hypothetical protein